MSSVVQCKVELKCLGGVGCKGSGILQRAYDVVFWCLVVGEWGCGGGFFLYVFVQDDSMASQPDSNGETASSTGDVSIGFWWSAGVMRLLFLLNNIRSPAFHLLLLSLDIIKWA